MKTIIYGRFDPIQNVQNSESSAHILEMMYLSYFVLQLSPQMWPLTQQDQEAVRLWKTSRAAHSQPLSQSQGLQQKLVQYTKKGDKKRRKTY